MKVSIITVSYQSEKTIEDTILSVLNQTDTRLEYWIIDGASKDNTVEIARSFEDAFRKKNIPYHIVSEPDHGIYDAMNKGIRLAGGDVIGILNSDDWYEPDTVKVVRETFMKEKPDVMFGDIRMHKADGTSFVKKARLRKYQTSRDWNHPTTFVKASVYKENPFPCMGIHDDYGFYLKMVKQHRKIVVKDVVLANFRMGGASNHKSLKEAKKRILDRYRYCYRINGFSRLYLIECVAMEVAKLLLG